MNKKLLIGIILLAVIAPIVLIIFREYVDGEKIGTLGDALGGLSSPLIGLIGAYLVYLSFQKQVEANEIQRKSMEEQKTALLDEIKRNERNRKFDAIVFDIYKLEEYLDQFAYQRFKGIEALSTYSESINSFHQNLSVVINTQHFRNIESYCMAFINILFLINDGDFQREEKRILFDRMAFVYGWKFKKMNKSVVSMIEKNKEETIKFVYKKFYDLIQQYEKTNKET